MKTVVIKVDGEEVPVVCEKIANKTWFHLNGETYCYEPPKASRLRGGVSEVTSPGVVMAPMPGKIIKLNVSVGDAVKQGDSLLVMEAMKMEYNLESDVDGQVVEVNCSLGDQVAHEQLLVKVQGSVDESKS